MMRMCILLKRTILLLLPIVLLLLYSFTIKKEFKLHTTLHKEMT